MTQIQQVIEVMRSEGGFATFGRLNSLLGFATWKTKTPEATVRRIVQDSQAFFKVRPGLWALTERKDELLSMFQLDGDDKKKQDAFNHSYYQGLILEIGNLRHMRTFVPSQDKNKLFLGKPMREIATLPQIYEFTYPKIVKKAKTVDVIWFNERDMPCAFFEVEHSTDIKNSLLKFYELQDFSAKFYIVAGEYRRKLFDDVTNYSIFKPIKRRIEFKSYDFLSQLHSQAYGQVKSETL